VDYVHYLQKVCKILLTITYRNGNLGLDLIQFIKTTKGYRPKPLRPTSRIIGLYNVYKIMHQKRQFAI